MFGKFEDLLSADDLSLTSEHLKTHLHKPKMSLSNILKNEHYIYIVYIT